MKKPPFPLSPNKKVPSMKDNLSKMGGASPKLPTGVGQVASQTNVSPKKKDDSEIGSLNGRIQMTKKKSFANASSGTKGKGTMKGSKKSLPLLPSKMCPSCIKGKASSCSHM